jgi:subtilisin family serine protease
MPSRFPVFALLVCVGLIAASDTARTQAPGSNRIRDSRRPVPDQYIVVLADGADADDVVSDAEAAFGARRKHLFRRAVRGFSIRVNRSGAERLSRDPRVKYVEQDGVVALTQAPPVSWGLDRINQRALPLDDDRTFGAIGAGIMVHVIDTGLRTTHAEFGGRAFIAGDYVDDDGDGDALDIDNDDGNPLEPDGADCHGHGTHVAGTIGGATYGAAKGVTLLAHRVLTCGGVGTISSVVAAVDAITATTARPAIANMSLGGSASEVLDDAIRQSIQSGVTYVVAAGNNNDSAANYSPARVPEAITVGATTGADVRASFSNIGSALDLFAPGVGILSAAHTSDSSTTVMSGTSMAAPHVAGVVALHLEGQPSLTPQAVRDVIVGAATPNVVLNRGLGSPNRLLYADLVNLSPPTVVLLRPADGENVPGGAPFTISWDASDPDGLQQFDVLLSTDGGATFNPLPGCELLAAAVRDCDWPSPGPGTSTARLKVVARDETGDEGLDQSMADFSIVGVAAPLPDLQVTSISGVPATAAPGDSFIVLAPVQNSGNATAGTSTLRFYLSTDSARSPGDVRLPGKQIIEPLDPGATSASVFTLKIPKSTLLGLFHVVACADDRLNVAESDEYNCLATATPMLIGRPDLLTIAVSNPPFTVVAGKSFVASDSVHNPSPVPAAKSATRYYLSLDTAKGPGDVPLNGLRKIPALQAAATSTGNRTVTVPAGTAPGTYHLLACADDNADVIETDEANNCRPAGTAVLVTLPG